ncbi:hypothetical protein AXG93_4079s1130 [Marchantia polymorpha subsp. ruderalis]|uniref:Reverse transcriptase Ty1/copia-type domain-containing protein n=1 Tax=Marchantia polymorpha subsp. ruderalis TaxID=1480154 RepID=A0A176VT58_MARPO|nr:hypothetical protein AXG93_4079s1130 [Marchantia polymorpha subsp. ruderalis]
MKRSFKISDLGCLGYYLGIKVKQQPRRITLSQAAYAAKLLEKAGMHCNIVQIPMENHLKLKKQSTTPRVDASYYCNIVGSLRYLVYTRPNIGFAVGFVNRFMENLTMEHLSTIKHIFCNMAFSEAASGGAVIM